MPRAIQLVSGFFTAAGAGAATVTPTPGDTFAVASGNNEGPIKLEQLWQSGAVGDYISVFSPRMHDNNQGIRVQSGGVKGRNLLPWGADQALYPADTPTVQAHATGVGTTGVMALYEYDDLPGASQRLATWADIRGRIEQLSTVEVDVTSSATIGSYGAGVALNGTFDNFKANRDYAWLGWTTNAIATGIAISGPDTSNYRIGGPSCNDVDHTKNMWIDASEQTGRPFIPVFAANNKGTTLVQAVDVAASTVLHVSLHLALLK